LAVVILTLLCSFFIPARLLSTADATAKGVL